MVATDEPTKAAAEAAAEQNAQADRENALIFWTAPLFVATAALALVAGGQAYLFLVQLRYMRDAADDAKTAANAAKDTAAAALAQTEILAKQHAVGRLQFYAANPPLLKIRFVHRIDGAQPQMSFIVVNAGASRAVVVGSCAVAEFMHPDDKPNVHDEKRYPRNAPVKRHFLDPGNGDRCLIPISNSHSSQEPILRLYGYVVYRNDNERVTDEGGVASNTRTTYFMREFAPTSLSFEPVTDPDYNAED